ncbi:MAG: TonB-dependent receptor [Phormidesmis sp.]
MQLIKGLGLKRFGLGLLASALGLFFVELPAHASQQQLIEQTSKTVSKAAPDLAAANLPSEQLIDELVAQQPSDTSSDTPSDTFSDTVVTSELVEAPVLASSLTLQSLSNAAITASESAQSQASQSEAELTPQVSSQTTPRFAPQARPQPVAQSLDEILENEQAEQTIIEPGSPVGTEIRNNERIQGEVEAEIDEVILRQVPDARLLEDIYTLEIAPVLDSRVEADRRSTVKIAGQVNDENGELINHDVVVTLTTSAGEFIGADYDIDRAGFQVLARWGEFDAELRSNLDAQRVLVRASAARKDLLAETPMPLDTDLVTGAREIEGYTDVNFITPLRPSLVTGVVDLRFGNASTNMWGSFSDFLRPEDIGDTEFSGGGSIFATGAIGDWLFTGAYNSRRNLNERCDGGTRLYQNTQEQFCTYEIYGDSSTNDYLTPSQDSVYLRLQQDAAVLDADPNYFMWGDYSTDEFSRSSQLFSATSRQLHGFIGNYTLAGGEDSGLQLTAMYANNIRPFKRDTIVPDGTSGYYFLSESEVLPGSEEVFIEVEELNRPGTVVERIPLARRTDYRIDYNRGAILFNQPVSITDANPFGATLVRRIVVAYQREGEESGGNLYGGRLQYNFSYDIDSPSWIGASVVTETDNLRDFTLYGVDALFSLGDTGQIVAEYANSSLSDGIDRDGDFDGDGSAYRIEARSDFTDNLFGRAYWRSADEGFSNTATTSFRPGQTRYGAEISALVSESTLLEFQYDREENRGNVPVTVFDQSRLFGSLNPEFVEPVNSGFFSQQTADVDDSLTTLRAGLQQQFGSTTFDLGYVYRDRSNDLPGGLDFSSQQIVSGLTLPLARNLSFRAQNEFNIGNDDDPLYPGRTVLGLDWQVLPEITVRLAQQFFEESDVTPDSITSLDTLLDYDLSDNTQLTGRYSVLGGYSGITGQGAVGLNHRLNISPGLNVDLGYERIVGQGLGNVLTGGRVAESFAIGQSAAALGILPGSSYSVGVEYLDNPSFQASARAEYRDNDGGDDNTVLTASLAGKLSRSLTALGRYEYANYANQELTGRFDDTSAFKLGLAYRNPDSDTFNGLLSYEYATNPDISANSLDSSGINEHTLSAEGIYAPNYRWEFYGKYALRNTNADLSSLGTGLGDLSNTIHLAQMRAAYRFAYRWDVVGEARYITSPTTDYSETGLALETGYYVTPDLRLGVGYSFGSADDRSFQGNYRDDGGFYVAATFKVNELFNGFGLQDIAPAQQTEALIAPEDAIAVDGNCPDGVDPEAGGVDPCENRVFETPTAAESATPVVPSIPMNPVIVPETSEPEFSTPAEPIRGLW